MKYYIDLDNTLFDTEKFVFDINQILLKYHVSKEIIDEIYNFEELGFNLINNIKRIVASNYADQIMNEIYLLLANKNHYLYDDSLMFLEDSQRKNREMILLTRGNREYQTLKIESTDIEKYFREIIITDDYKDILDLDYQHSCFIDDNIVELKRLQENGASVIRLRRKLNKHSRDDLENVLEVESFSELINIL